MAEILDSSLTSGVISAMINDSAGTKYWYDNYHYYYEYDSKYTPKIDDILIQQDKYVTLGPVRIINGSQKVPGIGKHYYYYYSSNSREWFSQGFLKYREYYIGLEKVAPSTGGKEYYICWKSPLEGGKTTFRYFSSLLEDFDNERVETISIDLSEHQPQLTQTTKICKTHYPRQMKAVDFILGEWNSENNFNHKVFLYGKRGNLLLSKTS